MIKVWVWKREAVSSLGMHHQHFLWEIRSDSMVKLDNGEVLSVNELTDKLLARLPREIEREFSIQFEPPEGERVMGHDLGFLAYHFKMSDKEKEQLWLALKNQWTQRLQAKTTAA